ncbi:hypothetical protein PAESOLCIP111_06670 [Paenibacillus solanacearum]|uniref:Uncharacterized protein n=1 Tax=Paenibacillus solanacearum TaxID=2048548 RepID=A0A916KAP4_9BACL|nr:hypothetical protein PAESOLCIP111_06670 [Paenibacillus solanacearum]
MQTVSFKCSLLQMSQFELQRSLFYHKHRVMASQNYGVEVDWILQSKHLLAFMKNLSRFFPKMKETLLVIA